MISTVPYEKYFWMIDRASNFIYRGKVEHVIGMSIEAIGPSVSLGDLCYIDVGVKQPPLMAEVVGFKNERVILMPLGDIHGIQPGAHVRSERKPLSIRVGNALLGRVLNGMGEPIDSLGPLILDETRSLQATPPDPLTRSRILEPISTGVKAIDTLVTMGKGQRMGIFAGSGVGKSSLMGMITRFANADVIVIGMIGERGREVREFIEKDLGEEGLKKSVVVVETGERPPLLRIRAAHAATTIAEYFRDQGKDVILMLDSLTRVAMAQREVGLAVGEPPATKGYTPSVFSLLPQLLERSGCSDKGTITGLYTVLVESDDFNEPISDAARSILDGHLMLTRELASIGHYPSIDVLQSISRLMVDIATDEQRELAQRMRETLGAYKEAEDLINIGAYVKGSNPKVDFAMSKQEEINRFLRQSLTEGYHMKESIDRLKILLASQEVQVG